MIRSDRYLVLGLARPRTEWLADVGAWAASSTIPVEFIRCVSADEVRSRLETDRRHSAVLLDDRILGIDRELFDTAASARCATLIVTDAAPRRDWLALGASAVLDSPLDPESLTTALGDHALPSERRPSALTADTSTDEGSGRLVAVTGIGGSGASTTAMALAVHLAATSTEPPALIDACRHADQALLHDLGDVLPGLPELVELHRTTTPDDAQIRSHLWSCPRHGYDLLPGLRRHRDWSGLRRRSTTAALRSLRRAYPLVVADVDLDVEGERETGSIDVEERNHLAREILTDADAIVITTRPGPTGISRLVRSITDLEAFGAEPARIIPVVIGAPRSRRDRSAIVSTVRALLDEIRPDRDRPSPVMIQLRRDLDSIVIDGLEPGALSNGAIAQAVEAVLRTLPPRTSSSDTPVAIVPGHLGLTA